MRFLSLPILLLIGFAVHAQNPYIGRYMRFVAVDTTTLVFPTGTGGIYYNVSTGKMMYKDATGYHRFGTGATGGGGGSIDAVNGTTNRIDVTGTTTRTVNISSTFEALLGKVASPLSQFAATTSAQLRGVLSDEVGTGNAYFQGGALGTPASATLTNATGLPITGITSTASDQLAGILTDETGSGGGFVRATSPTLTTPNLGTPSTLNLANATNLPSTGLASMTSAQFRSVLSDEVGTGAFYTVGGALGTPASATGTNFTGIPMATGITGSSANLATALSDEVGSGPLYFGQPTGANTTYAGSHTLEAADIGNNNSGIVRITGSSASTFTIPTVVTYAAPTYALVAIYNNSSDTVTLAFAGGVTPVGNGDTKIGPYQMGSVYKTATNTWSYFVPGAGSGDSGPCAMAVSNETSTHSFTTADVAACNNTGAIRYTGTADVNFTMPLYATEPFEQGTTIAINNQSAYNITIVMTGGITGGGHSYPVVQAGQTATLINGGVNVWDILGTTPTSLSASATLNFGNTAAGAISDLTVTVTGAAVGDVVSIGAPSIPDKGTYFGYVSATNTVTVRFANNDLTTAKDPSSGTFKVKVFK